MGTIGIVCDSTADLALEWYAANNVEMVPLKVLFGDETLLDWVDIAPERFFERLIAAATLPKTSQPSPADFEAAYAKLAETGATEIVSIHLTAALSGTFESATMAAATSQVPVRVVDTKHVTQALGLAVKAAVAARDAGGDADAIEKAAIDTARITKLFFVLDTLEYLVKGGRAGKATGLAASLLDIKPVLTFNAEGTIEPFKKERGRKRAFAALAAQVSRDSMKRPVRVALFHACAPKVAEELKAALDAAGADYELDSIGLVGAVIGTYAGPEAAGLAYHPVP